MVTMQIGPLNGLEVKVEFKMTPQFVIRGFSQGSSFSDGEIQLIFEQSILTNVA